MDTIAENIETPDFKNTIAALECSGKALSLASSAFVNLASAETNDIIEKTKTVISSLLAAFRNDVTLNEKLFSRVKEVYNNRHLSRI